MKQETAIKHFYAIPANNNMIAGVLSDSGLRRSIAITQHKERPDSTDKNTTLFIRQSTFDQIVRGEYCAQHERPIGNNPNQIERYVCNRDIVAKVTTKKHIDGYEVEIDLIDDDTGDATFNCQFQNDEWLLWHMNN
ncbi:hypothetical protein [Microbulbifer sp. VAAF005]|uniref:hypothetical protein n=1 Tax=Microbulbifer sp. VAAF005 TaxID=3034230 RepID=UPI0024AE7BED|nr:hypothetical protein [Microbulbifer sp. VAAF005]WHI46966.1 hypothetical protein P0078_00920 [Microbulbifer sp. VAAF005]